MQHYGRLDILVNNAGLRAGNPIDKLTEEQWTLVLDSHLKASFAMTKAVCCKKLAESRSLPHEQPLSTSQVWVSVFREHQHGDGAGVRRAQSMRHQSVRAFDGRN